MTLPKAFIDDVTAQADVVDVVGRYVELKKTGINYSGLCPFHSEKSPSFTVSPSKQFYHCFGCGAHGDALAFLIEYSGMSFPEAVEKLATEQGKVMPAPEYTPEEARRKAHEDRLFGALSAAKDIFYKNLRGHLHVIQYLKERGLTGATVQKFGLGYAHFDDISKGLSSVPTQTLLDAGLLVANEETGEVYDRYRKRVVFPIHNERGVVIGFGGRVINDDDKPKYINSPETLVFQKGEELFGLYFAKGEIRKTRKALLFEGYLDVIMLHQHGDQRAVGVLGTSMTENQLRRLFRICDEATFCFDGDRAGRAAADRAARMSLAALEDGKTARFLTLPGDHDPDSFVREYGIEAWLQEVEHASIPLSSKVLEMLIRDADLSVPEHRVAVSREAAKLLASIKNAPLFAAALKSHIESLISVPVAHQTSRVPAVPAPRESNSVKSLLPQAEYRTFYQNFALLCGLSVHARELVRKDLVDGFAELIAGWFEVAPADHKVRVDLAATDKSQLGAFVREALDAVAERHRSLSEDGLTAEVSAIVAAIDREAQRRDAAARTSALFD